MPASQSTTTTEYFSVQHTAGVDITFRVLRLSDGYILNAADSVFQTVAAAPDPNFSATEQTALGNATYSQYTVAIDMSKVNTDNLPAQFLVQFRHGEDILSTTLIWVAAARQISMPLMRL